MKATYFATLTAVLTALSNAAAIPRTAELEEIESVRTLIRSLPADPRGIFQLGPDNVLRSLNAEREVLASVQLPPEVVAQMKVRDGKVV